jgi:hypothetical protein
MKFGLKTMLPVLAAVTTLASVICSADDMQMRNLENRVSALEQRRGSNGMINPPARPVVRDGTDLWVQVEALIMHATEDCLSYGIKNDTAAVAGATVVDGRVKNVDYSWNWGFRAGIGYNLPHDGWDMLLNWTWFQAHESKNEKPLAPETVLANLAATQGGVGGVGGVPIAFPSAKGKATLHMNLLDLELGREFFVSKWLTLRPFVGGRAAWFNRGFKFSYSGVTKLKGKDHNRFRAGGIRGGLDTQWGLGSGWSFFGDLALSLLYGKQRMHSPQDLSSGVRVQHTHNAWSAVRSMIDLAVGLRWDHLFGCNDAYRIRLQLGWEQTALLGFEKDMNYMNGTLPGKFAYNSGDLAVSGVSFQARFDF